jgi:spore germination cell wall hydrolase CwlJ-like protein
MITAITCLAMAVYYEARGEPAVAQLAVAEVVVNRVVSPMFPNNVCDVVKEDRGPRRWDCQFSFWCDGKPERPKEIEAWSTARDIAEMALSGVRVGHNATHYHSTSVKPKWAKNMTPVATFGSHIFYVDKPRPTAPVPNFKPPYFSIKK